MSVNVYPSLTIELDIQTSTEMKDLGCGTKDGLTDIDLKCPYEKDMESPDETGVMCTYPGAAITYNEAVTDGRAGEQGWGWLDVLISYTLFVIVIGFFVYQLEMSKDTDYGNVPAYLMTLCLAISWLPLGGWPIIASYWKGNGPVVDFGFTLRWTDVGWGLAFATIGSSWFIVYLFICSFLRVNKQMRFYPYDAYFTYSDSFDDFAILFWPTVDVFVKGIFCFGLVFTTLAKSLQNVGHSHFLVIFLTAASFVCVYFPYKGYVYWFSLGLLFAIVRFYSGSLTATMMSHCFLYYLVVFLYVMILYLSGYYDEDRRSGQVSWLTELRS